MKVSVRLIFVLLVMCECVLNLSDKKCLNVKTDFTSVRKRRHLTFPDKSNVVLTISLVKAIMTHAPAGWNIALEIDVLFPLPDEKTTNRFYRRKLHHKQKREFWERIQGALDLHNLNGRSCILRSICEARIHLAPPGKSLVHDVLRVIFTAPLHEQDFKEEMNEYYEFSDSNFCEQNNDCPISILDFLLTLNTQYY